MLIGLREALSYADQHNSAIAAVNTPFFEALTATIRVGERTGLPIILQCAQVHENITPLDEIGPAMVALATRSEGKFVLHIDHGDDIDYIRRGLDIGFNSCMIDASRRPYDENVKITREVVEMAHARDIAVEGEIGVMTGNENGDPSQGIADETLYTDAAMATTFVEATGVDCLAASFGTVHGVYRRKPHLNYELISQLREQTGVPIVMHGGSGLSDDEYKECIRHGVRKINYYTYAAKAAYDAAAPLIDDESSILFSNLAVAAQRGVEADVSHFVSVLATPTI
ncbi:class II fructose-bisphosphate aldolase [Acidipropionibacterium timonense]|uniref:class II fructose-bisphosphate aldolase n=1 Tax=Acidipropionibacterium timonense TaxID=2161818 RepID=UPI00103013BC|nr:class II fructose-bisphosphate aldolase [Acidipropionibacterium timonense]